MAGVRNLWHFLVFWFDVALRTLALVPQAFKRLDFLYGVVPIVLGATAAWYLDLISWWTVFIVLLVFGLMWAVYEKWKEVNDRKEALEEKLAFAVKRKAVKDLLGDVLEEGLSLKQGRKYSLESENQDLEDIEVSDEYRTRYDEEVRTWVDRTYNLINDAFGKDDAQRFISNEGYTDQELFGRELPSFMHLSATQRKYLIPARLKRLDKVIDKANSLPINPDFNPEDYPWDWIRR